MIPSLLSENQIQMVRSVSCDLYEKLHQYCSLCLRLSHESSACPERPRAQPQPRDHRRDPDWRREEEDDQRRKRMTREGGVGRTRRHSERLGREETVVTMSPKVKPLRRDIMPELEVEGESQRRVEVSKESTKAWVHKTFGDGSGKGDLEGAARRKGVEVSMESEKVGERGQANWYRSEEVAGVINRANAEVDRWREMDRNRRGKETAVEGANTEKKKEGRGGLGSLSEAKEDGENLTEKLEVDNGLAEVQAQEERGERGTINQSLVENGLGLNFSLSPTEVISPLKGLVVTKTRPSQCERPKGVSKGSIKPRRIEQRISKALGPKKKIEHSPFRGKRIHKHMSLAKLAPGAEDLKTRLEAAQSSDISTFEEISELQTQLRVALREEEIYWQQKSRVMWHQEGDQNTWFFQASTKQRRARNKIIGILKEDGTWMEKEDEIEETSTLYFANIFSSSTVSDLETSLQYLPATVTEEMNAVLTREVTAAEVRDAVFAIHPEKAQGPDGMTALFYQKFWM